LAVLEDSSSKTKHGRPRNPKGKASNSTGTPSLHLETNTVTADSAVESQLAEKDRELEELRWQLQEAQDKERDRKQNATQHGLHPLFIMLTVDALVVFNRQYLPSSQS